MLELADLLADATAAAARAWLADAIAVARDDPSRIPLLFPQLPRRIGREFLPGGRLVDGTITIDSGAWRSCDAAALALLTARGDADTASLIELHDRGDLEERTMLLRALGCLPITAVTGRLLREAQRSNQVVHVAACVLDSNLLARTLDEGEPEVTGFGLDDFDRMLLKLAYLDLPLARAFDAETHANAELSRMLQGLASEREAAGRKVWHDTNRMIGRAPTSGSIARLLGGLEHGDDAHRLAAVEGLIAVDRPELRPFLEDRIAREDRPAIRALLERALAR